MSHDDVDPCTGFPTTHKAKLSIPTIVWHKQSDNTILPELIRQNSLSVDPTIPEENQSSFHFKTFLLTLLSAIVFSLNAVIVKLLNHFHPFNLGVWIFLLMMILSVLSLILGIKVKNTENNSKSSSETWLGLRQNLYGKTALFLSIRAVAGVAAMIFFFYSMKYLAVADAVAINSSSPIFIYLMAFIFLGERFGILPAVTTVAALAGATLITRPPLLVDQSEYDLKSLIGVILAFSAMLCLSVNVIVLKFLENVHYGIVNLTFATWGTVQCLFISWICGVISIPYELSDILKILCSGILYYLGQDFIILALQIKNEGSMEFLRTTEVLLAFVWQFLFLGVVPDLFSYAGALLIVVGTTLIVLRKWVSTLPSTNRFGSKCNFLLY